MGPEAGVNFWSTLKNIVASSVYRVDDTHPCRVAYLEGRGVSPAPSIAQTIKRSIVGGIEYIVIACNTAHTVLDEIKALLPSDIAGMMIDMVSLTIAYVSGKNAVWFGTTVLANSGMFDNTDICLPSKADQDIIQAAIWAAKEGLFPYSQQIAAMCENKVVVAGCTEMPMIFDAAGVTNYINPVDVVAEYINTH